MEEEFTRKSLQYSRDTHDRQNATIIVAPPTGFATTGAQGTTTTSTGGYSVTTGISKS